MDLSVALSDQPGPQASGAPSSAGIRMVQRQLPAYYFPTVLRDLPPCNQVRPERVQKALPSIQCLIPDPVAIKRNSRRAVRHRRSQAQSTRYFGKVRGVINRAQTGSAGQINPHVQA